MLQLTREMPRMNTFWVDQTAERLHSVEFGWNHGGRADGALDLVGNVFGRSLYGLGITSLHHDTRQELGS